MKEKKGIRTPLLAADAVILFEGGIVLIQRDRPPYAGCYALPGGFVEIGESIEAAAIREAREETGLETEVVASLGAGERAIGALSFAPGGPAIMHRVAGSGRPPTPVARDAERRHVVTPSPTREQYAGGVRDALARIAAGMAPASRKRLKTAQEASAALS